MKTHRIIGIDPGYATVGWGIVDYAGSSFKTVDYGAIITPPDLPFEHRLEIIYRELDILLSKHTPEGMGIEKLFFGKNVTTGIDVAQARGVILLCARAHGVNIKQYAPNEVKLAVVGYGNAEKAQVMQMTKMLLNLSQMPKPDDTADALAVAICHAHSAASYQYQNKIDNRQ